MGYQIAETCDVGPGDLRELAGRGAFGAQHLQLAATGTEEPLERRRRRWLSRITGPHLPRRASKRESDNVKGGHANEKRGRCTFGLGGVDVERDDQQLLEWAIFVYEALYAWCRRVVSAPSHDPVVLR